MTTYMRSRSSRHGTDEGVAGLDGHASWKRACRGVAEGLSLVDFVRRGHDVASVQGLYCCLERVEGRTIYPITVGGALRESELRHVFE